MLACRYHKSKNLIDFEDIVDHTVGTFYYHDVNLNFTLEANKTYTISVDLTSTLQPFNFSLGCGNTTYAKFIAEKNNNNNGRISITFTPTSTQLQSGNKLWARFVRYVSPQTYTYSAKRVQLEEGSTATPYDPYGEGLFPVACAKKGKNLLGGTINRTQSTISFNDGVGIINESATDGKRHQWSNPFTLPAGTYTYSIRMLNPESVTNRHSSGIFLAQVYKYTTSMTWDQVCGNVLVYYNNPYATATFTLTEPTQMILSDYCRSETFNNTIFHIQIEKGSTATPYEPYSDGLLPLMSENKFSVGYVTVDLGTLNWATNGDGRFTCVSLPTPAKFSTNIDVKNSLYCDKYMVDIPRNVWNKVNDKTITTYPSGASGPMWVIVYDTDYTTVSAFKAAMSGIMLTYEKEL